MIRLFHAATTVFAVVMVPGLIFAQAAEVPKTSWPPAVDATVATKKAFPGRKVEFFRHGTRPEWGYAQPQQDFFILVHPENPQPDSPVYVVLHSAGHDAKSAFEIGADGPDGPSGPLYCTPVDCYGLYPDCRANGPAGDWWWGGPQPNQNPLKNLGPHSTPTEKRVEDTVKWVLAQYPTDGNRVYLTGISMGGSGSLGFGMPRGDIFASILAHVPAGALHVEQRMQFPPVETPAGLTHPDPPFVVAYSGVNDGWAKDQATLIKGMRAGKFAFIDFWGLSGHDVARQAIISKCDLAYSFPWMSIKKNEAYPVFTDASSDSKIPWTAVAGEPSDQTGQINAAFRWKNIVDTPTSFSMELWSLSADDLKTSMPIPKESTADVTIRRLQKFQVPAGKECDWEQRWEGKIIAKGSVQPDQKGLLTIPRMIVGHVPSLLKLSVRP